MLLKEKKQAIFFRISELLTFLVLKETLALLRALGWVCHQQNVNIVGELCVYIFSFSFMIVHSIP